MYISYNSQLFISENANVQRKTPTNKIDDVFFNNFKWNNIPTTVPWAHLGNALKFSNAPNGLFHLSGLVSLMIFSYYGFMEWTCTATVSHNWGQKFESCIPWCLTSDRKCMGKVRQHSAKSRGFSPVSSHNQFRLGVLVKVGTLSRHKLQQLPAHVNSP